MTNYEFQDYQLKPIQAIRYDGTLQMAAWLANQNNEFTLYSDDDGFSLHLRGVEVEEGQYIRKDWVGYFSLDDDFDLYHEPVPNGRPSDTKGYLLDIDVDPDMLGQPIKGM